MSNNQKGLSLIEAIANITLLLKDSEILEGVTFEDGSGYKFNYLIHGKWRFVDFSSRKTLLTIHELTLLPTKCYQMWEVLAD